MNGIKYRSADEMKDSGIEWIGKIPKKWSFSKVGFFYDIQLGKMLQPQKSTSCDSLENYLCSVNVDWMEIDTDNTKEMWFSAAEKKKYDVQVGDLIVNEGGDAGKAGFVKRLQKNVYFQNAVHRVRSQKKNDLHVLYYWLFFLKSVGYIDLICNKSTIMHFTGDKFYNLISPVICVSEQSKISNFLDIKTAQFDSIIAKKEQLIAKLEEAKKSLISEVVTGKVKIVDGKLVPRQPEEMKDSGVEWLGKIPKDWKHSKVKFELDFYDNKRIPLSSEERGKISDKIYDYYGASGVIDQVDNYIFNGTYILVGEDGANLYSRSSPLAFLAMGKFWVNNHAHILKSKNDQDKFYVHLLESIDYFNNITGSAQPKLTQENLGSIVIFVPKYEEQNYISSFLDTKLEELNRVVLSIENQINAIKSAKQSLISEAVTGKIDLRDWEINEQGGAS